ncbi:MAG: tetratricopeptide repeat protein [Candidatus Cyclobacteriaceae bacterium M2_1C_046]
MIKKQLFLIGILFLILSGCKDERSDLGDKYYERGEYKKAIESYNEYINLNPEHLKSIYNRGRAYEELGQYDQAVQDYRHVLKNDPENVRALLSMAKYYYSQEDDYENAIFYVDKALKIDDKNAMAYVIRGRANQKLGNIQEALSDYNNAIAVNRDYADAYLSRGSLRFAVNNKTKACADFKTASALGSAQADELLEKYCR